MATEDSNGLVIFQDTDNLVPLHSTLNTLTASISDAFNENMRIYPVSSTGDRSTLVSRIGLSNISVSRPLFVWRSNATQGRNLEYTTNGSVWHYYTSVSDDTGWVNITYESGFTAGTPGQLQYRRIGNMLYLRGGATGTFTSGAYHVVGSLPSDMWPTATVRDGAAGQGGRSALWEANVNGNILFCWQALGGSAPSWIALSAAIPLG